MLSNQNITVKNFNRARKMADQECPVLNGFHSTTAFRFIFVHSGQCSVLCSLTVLPHLTHPCICLYWLLWWWIKI